MLFYRCNDIRYLPGYKYPGSILTSNSMTKDNSTYNSNLILTWGVLRYQILPHSAPSWILSKAENLASPKLQDGATKWVYFLKETTHPPDHMDFCTPISQLLLARFGSNFKQRVLGTYTTDNNCHHDICPGNICPGDICPHQQYCSFPSWTLSTSVLFLV